MVTTRRLRANSRSEGSSRVSSSYAKLSPQSETSSSPHTQNEKRDFSSLRGNVSNGDENFQSFGVVALDSEVASDTQKRGAPDDDDGDKKPAAKARVSIPNIDSILQTRKRMIKADGTEEAQVLSFLDKSGQEMKVRLILASRPYISGDTSSGSSPEFLGNDGNQYYCQVCGGFGDVVCCDGCPRVFHHLCVPLKTKSRKLLDSDADPWYCPVCTDESAPRNRRSEKGDRRTSQQRCVDCEENRPELQLAPCSGCGTYVHWPSCDAGASILPPPEMNVKVFCQNCLAIDEEEEPDRQNAREDYSRRERNNNASHAANGSMDQDRDIDMDDGDDERGVKRKLDKAKRKKKKMKRRHSMSSVSVEEERPSNREASSQDDPLPANIRQAGPVQATPAFVFYLAENRWKIEKTLARSHRTFNRLPKGDQRNALVAQEAVQMWTKIDENEQKRYIDMSMREFEARIIQWKEEKLYKESSIAGFGIGEDDQDGRSTADADARLTYEKHQRLYLSTSVGSKDFRPEPDQSYNRVLLDLLYDNRFHSLPMFTANRPPSDTISEDNPSKVSIPYFEVHGPVSTSIGDECLGCARAWNHFCPVLQRRVPAVEHRAKLQPPLSSLMATRIGLGLRPRLDRSDDTKDAVGDDATLLEWRDSGRGRDVKELPVVPSCSIYDPSDRADDIVQFIEETTAMKVPEPPRPSNPDSGAKKKPARPLPTLENQYALEGEIGEAGKPIEYNKCGRCRTIIFNDTGCVQCRRAQLVINRSKKVPASGKDEGKSLNVHTAMLGRVQLKEGPDEVQSEADAAVSEAMLKERWNPNAILPPNPPTVPAGRVYDLEQDSDDGEEQDNDGDEEAEDGHAEVGELGNEQFNKDEASGESVSASQEDEGTATTPTGSAVDDDDDEQLAVPKRTRSTRIQTLASSSKSTEVTEDRQVILKQHKKEADELHKKTVRIACYGILLSLMRRDPLHLFAQPAVAEGYSAAIRNPIDFGKIRQNVLTGRYASLGAFTSDARLLCENALAYNPPASVYYKTAEEMHRLLAVMQKRAVDWISAIKDAHSGFLLRKEAPKRRGDANEEDSHSFEQFEDDTFAELRRKWPEAIETLENGDAMRKLIESDFMRTKENETSFYGCIAVRRAAAAAEASLAPYPDSSGCHSVVSKRKHYLDEELREFIDKKVSETAYPELKMVSSWREESVVRLARKVQKARLDRTSLSENGCSRCEPISQSPMRPNIVLPVKPKKKGDADNTRVDSSRLILTTGLGSAKNCRRIATFQSARPEEAFNSVHDACVSVRGSRIHGMGLYADQPFRQGDVVAEYLGEWVVSPMADKREKMYREQRIQDYQFRVDDRLVIDATMHGGPGRYINHNCTPNCKAKIVPGNDPYPHLRRVLIIAQRYIDVNEEISYDYQFPLELDLSARIPCNCQSESCRGFMNWDLPEKGSNNRALLVQKRGANMRDRIRRLNRPLKRDES